MNSTEFFEKFFAGTQQKIELRVFDSHAESLFSRDTTKLTAFIKNKLAENINVYFGIATRDPTPQSEPGSDKKTHGGKINCRELTAVWGEIDFKDVPQDEAIKLIDAYSPSPSLVISSGGGLHIYWLLKTPIDAHDPRVEPILKRLAADLKADDICAELARVLRPPGTKNFKKKYGTPQDVIVLREDWDRRYELSDFPTQTAYGVAPAKIDHAANGDKVPVGKRYQWLLSRAGGYRRRGDTEAEIFEKLKIDFLGHCADAEWNGEHEATLKQLARGIGSKPAETADTGEDGESQIIIEHFSDVVARPVVWLWPERIPAAKLTIFSGNPDEGKTTIFGDILARATTKSDWPDGAKNELEPCDALILNNEDDPADTLKPRLIAAGADLTRVHYLKCVRITKKAKKFDRMLALDTDLALLEQALAANPKIKLVGIDPISGYLGRADMNKEQELRRVLTPVAELAERTGVTFIGLGHFNKRANVRALHRVGGAVAMSGVARAVWMFMRDPKAVETNQYLMLLGKGNLTRKRTGLKYGFVEKKVDLPDGSTTGAPAIAWTGDAIDDAETSLQVASDPKEKSSARAEEFLRAHLAGKGEIASNWIEQEAKKHRITRNTLFDVKKQQGIRATRKNGQWWWVWDGAKS